MKNSTHEGVEGFVCVDAVFNRPFQVKLTAMATIRLHPLCRMEFPAAFYEKTTDGHRG
ncbi:hypothetical protein LC605_23405 [Nostoc sp. CHAB 5836]|nr:hypothetical protein [Nostoc sp. CHAB 5836]